tara:strand:+ start:10690 stop:11241 length:552 start_codon:yes stop_codon:yes gene_type:complete
MNKKNEIVLGLDISTSITGATLMSNGEIIETLYWDTRNKRLFPSLYEKAAFIRRNFIYLEEKYKIDSIFIEQSLQSFRSGFSSAKTLSTLSRFNGMVSLLSYQMFNKKPEMVAASTARKLAGIEIKRGENAKEKVLKHVVDKHPQIVIEYTKHGNPKPGMYDMCDSIIIAHAGEKIVREAQSA